MAAVVTAAPTAKGDTLYIGVYVYNTSQVPTNADSTPTFTAYAGADLAAGSNSISSFTVTAITGQTGGYVISKATSSFDRGTYHGILAYAISSASRREMIEFVIA